MFTYKEKDFFQISAIALKIVERIIGGALILLRFGKPCSSNIVFAMFYFVIAVPSVLLLSFLTPPFSGADEPAHYLRIAGIASGQILPVRHGGGRQATAGGYLDDGLIELVKKSPFPAHRPANFRMGDGSIDELFTIRASARSSFVGYPNTAIYPPLVYLPGSIVAYGANTLHLPAIYWLYLERILPGLLAVCIIAACIWHSRFAAVPLLLLGSTPLTLFQISTISTEQVLIPFFFVFTVILLRIALGASQGPIENIISFVSVFITGPGKIAYMPLVILFPVASFWHDRKNAYRLAFFALSAIMAITFWAVWAYAIKDMVFSMLPDVYINPQSQMFVIIHNFAQFVILLIRTMMLQASSMPFYMLGRDLGGGNIYISNILLLPGMIILLVSSFVANEYYDNTAKLFLSAVLIAIGCIFAIYILIYLQFNAVGSKAIVGVQGRYFLPLAILCFGLAPKIKIPRYFMSLLTVSAMLWCICSAGWTTYNVYRTFW